MSIYPEDEETHEEKEAREQEELLQPHITFNSPTKPRPSILPSKTSHGVANTNSSSKKEEEKALVQPSSNQKSSLASFSHRVGTALSGFAFNSSVSEPISTSTSANPASGVSGQTYGPEDKADTEDLDAMNVEPIDDWEADQAFPPPHKPEPKDHGSRPVETAPKAIPPGVTSFPRGQDQVNPNSTEGDDFFSIVDPFVRIPYVLFTTGSLRRCIYRIFRRFH